MVEIWDYIADASEVRADAFIATIDAMFHTLATHPAIGRSREELADGIRSVPVGRFVIFYLPTHDGVEIVRVLHGARDIETILHEGD